MKWEIKEWRGGVGDVTANRETSEKRERMRGPHLFILRLLLHTRSPSPGGQAPATHQEPVPWRTGSCYTPGARPLEDRLLLHTRSPSSGGQYTCTAASSMLQAHKARDSKGGRENKKLKEGHIRVKWRKRWKKYRSRDDENARLHISDFLNVCTVDSPS